MKKVWTVLKQVLLDLVATGWTIFGLYIAWAVLPDGQTRDIVGVVLGALVLFWALTMPLRIDLGESGE